MDDEITDDSWIKKDWDYLLDNGYLSKETYDNIKNKNYTILTTDAFKDIKPGKSKTIYMHVNKLVANSDEYTYENHVEIIKIGGKIARTIREFNSDKGQINKEYIPGNYLPSDGKWDDHEVDDNRIIVRITPPTGSLSDIVTYVSILSIALIVIAAGAYIIKKKVL